MKNEDKRGKEERSACSKHAIISHQAAIITSHFERELVTSSAKY